MKKKIENYIIHLLGGYTVEDLNNANREVYEKTINRILTYMELLNGTPADDWCKLVYKYIKRKVE